MRFLFIEKAEAAADEEEEEEKSDCSIKVHGICLQNLSINKGKSPDIAFKTIPGKELTAEFSPSAMLLFVPN